MLNGYKSGRRCCLKEPCKIEIRFIGPERTRIGDRKETENHPLSPSFAGPLSPNLIKPIFLRRNETSLSFLCFHFRIHVDSSQGELQDL